MVFGVVNRTSNGGIAKKMPDAFFEHASEPWNQFFYVDKDNVHLRYWWWWNEEIGAYTPANEKLEKHRRSSLLIEEKPIWTSPRRSHLGETLRDDQL